MARYGAAIIGSGSYAPDRILTNHDLEQMVETSDEWIRTRTGIRERHIAADDEPTSAIACRAAEKALKAASVNPSDLDMIIVATLSPDNVFPNTGCQLQNRLGAHGAAAFSIEAACSGFLYAAQIAADMIRSGTASCALVVGAEKLSAYVDWTDRSTCVLFGDGAGAAIIKQVPATEDCFLASELGADGKYKELLQIPAGGTEMPLTHDILDQRLQYIKMSGREIFKLAVNAMTSASEKVLKQADISIDDVRWLVPHQANNRIITAVGKRLGIDEERVFINVDRYGNTSAATIPIAVDEIVRGGQVSKGDYLLLTAFGGGLTWGSLLVRW